MRNPETINGWIEYLLQKDDKYLRQGLRDLLPYFTYREEQFIKAGKDLEIIKAFFALVKQQ